MLKQHHDIHDQLLDWAAYRCLCIKDLDRVGDYARVQYSNMPREKRKFVTSKDSTRWDDAMSLDEKIARMPILYRKVIYGAYRVPVDKKEATQMKVRRRMMLKKSGYYYWPSSVIEVIKALKSGSRAYYACLDRAHHLMRSL